MDTGATGRAPVRPYVQLVPCRIGVREQLQQLLRQQLLRGCAATLHVQLLVTR